MRIIAHLDMDAFFASVEERDNPRFKGKPIVVGADPRDGKGRGVVSTANYKAREYGIRSAMPISEAWRRAEDGKKKGGPATIFVGGNFEKYGEVSGRIMGVIRAYAPLVEVASIDEAYFDLSFVETYKKAKEACMEIKKEIREKEMLTASIGIGPNKLLAKIASDMQKPDGLTLIKEDETESFLEPLPIRKIPGIGPKTEEHFAARGIKIVKDVKKLTHGELEEMMGKWGAELYRKVRGEDNSPVTEEYEIKSIGEQETFEQDSRDSKFVLERLKELSASVFQRLVTSDFKTFKAAVVTVRFADFETKTKTHTLPRSTSDQNTLQFEVMRLILPFLDKRENPRGKKLRLIGVRIEKLG